jgi:hypothetical protein
MSLSTGVPPEMREPEIVEDDGVLEKLQQVRAEIEKQPYARQVLVLLLVVVMGILGSITSYAAIPTPGPKTITVEVEKTPTPQDLPALWTSAGMDQFDLKLAINTASKFVTESQTAIAANDFQSIAKAQELLSEGGKVRINIRQKYPYLDKSYREQLKLEQLVQVARADSNKVTLSLVRFHEQRFFAWMTIPYTLNAKGQSITPYEEQKTMLVMLVNSPVQGSVEPGLSWLVSDWIMDWKEGTAKDPVDTILSIPDKA